MKPARLGLGLSLIAIGGLLAAISAGQVPARAEWLLMGRPYGYAVPLLTICTGALFATESRPSRGSVQGILSGALLIGLLGPPGFVLLSYGLAAIFPDGSAPLAAHGHKWFDMAPNTAAAYLATGVALCAAFRSGAQSRLTYVIAGLVVATIALSALLGHFLNLEALYTVAGMVSMRLPTAIALTAICFCLWILFDDLSPAWQQGVVAHGGRITRRSLMVLSLVALGSGVGGFSLLQGTLEGALADSMLVTARTNATGIKEGLNQKLWFPRVIASRPTVIQVLSELHQAPPTPENEAMLQDLMKSFLTADIRGVRFLGAARQVRGELGQFDGEGSLVSDKLTVDGLQAELRWHQGYLLRTEAPVEANRQVVGYVVTEQRLRVIDELLGELRSSSESADALICSRAGNAAVCAPTRFYPQPLSIPMFAADGKPNLPINRALLGEWGVQSATDLRGVRVIAAYVPVDGLGLGLVVKADVATLYAPLRERLMVLIPLMAVAIAMGAWALHVRVQPLLEQVLREQKRNSLILQKAHEAFISVDAAQKVVDWNGAAEAMLGISAADARGRPVNEVLRPTSPDQGRQTADGQPLNLAEGVREVIVIGAGGTPLTLEVSVTEHESKRGPERYVFARDLTARRLAEQRLRESEQALRTITDNVSALISRISPEGVILFVNEHCSRVYGLPVTSIVGRTLGDIRGPEALAQIRPYIDRVLGGESVMFESHSDIGGLRHFFQQSYVPDLGPDGRVRSFYAVSVDITAIKGNEQRLAESEKRLRDITDNLPVLISYIDRDQRVRFVNATCRHWLGVDPSEALGRPLADLDRDLAGDPARLGQALNGQRVSFEISICRGGTERHLATDYVPDLGHDGSVNGVYALAADVTRQKAVERQLTELLDRDALTGMANRRCLSRKLPEALARSKRNGTGLALMYLDVDRFKTINDSRGHAVGDAVLEEFARRLSSTVRETDTVVRVAGDEFVILLEGLGEKAEAGIVAGKIVKAMDWPFLVGAEPLSVSTSIGVAFQASSASMPDAEALMQRADAALYAAKRAGRACFRIEEEPGSVVA